MRSVINRFPNVLKDYTALSSNDDLNNFKKPGVYGCSSAAIAATISHNPSTGSNFTMLVLPKSSLITQIIFTNTTIYTRSETSSGLANTWYKYTGTSVST